MKEETGANTKARRITAKMRAEWAAELDKTGHLYCPMIGCFKKFVTVANFQTHYKWCTGKTDLQKCPYCDSLIITAQKSVYQHMEAFHPEKAEEYKKNFFCADSDVEGSSSFVVSESDTNLMQVEEISESPMKTPKRRKISFKENDKTDNQTVWKHKMKSINEAAIKNIDQFQKCVRFDSIVDKINSVDEVVHTIEELHSATDLKIHKTRRSKYQVHELPEKVIEKQLYFEDPDDPVDDRCAEIYEKKERLGTKSLFLLDHEFYKRYHENLTMTRDWSSARKTYTRSRGFSSANDSKISMQSFSDSSDVSQDTQAMDENLRAGSSPSKIQRFIPELSNSDNLLFPESSINADIEDEHQLKEPFEPQVLSLPLDPLNILSDCNIEMSGEANIDLQVNSDECVNQDLYKNGVFDSISNCFVSYDKTSLENNEFNSKKLSPEGKSYKRSNRYRKIAENKELSAEKMSVKEEKDLNKTNRLRRRTGHMPIITYGKSVIEDQLVSAHDSSADFNNLLKSSVSINKLEETHYNSSVVKQEIIKSSQHSEKENSARCRGRRASVASASFKSVSAKFRTKKFNKSKLNVLTLFSCKAVKRKNLNKTNRHFSNIRSHRQYGNPIKSKLPTNKRAKRTKSITQNTQYKSLKGVLKFKNQQSNLKNNFSTQNNKRDSKLKHCFSQNTAIKKSIPSHNISKFKSFSEVSDFLYEQSAASYNKVISNVILDCETSLIDYQDVVESYANENPENIKNSMFVSNIEKNQDSTQCENNQIVNLISSQEKPKTKLAISSQNDICKEIIQEVKLISSSKVNQLVPELNNKNMCATEINDQVSEAIHKNNTKNYCDKDSKLEKSDIVHVTDIGTKYSKNILISPSKSENLLKEDIDEINNVVNNVSNSLTEIQNSERIKNCIIASVIGSLEIGNNDCTEQNSNNLSLFSKKPGDLNSGENVVPLQQDNIQNTLINSESKRSDNSLALENQNLSVSHAIVSVINDRNIIVSSKEHTEKNNSNPELNEIVSHESDCKNTDCTVPEDASVCGENAITADNSEKTLHAVITVNATDMCEKQTDCETNFSNCILLSEAPVAIQQTTSNQEKNTLESETAFKVINENFNDRLKTGEVFDKNQELKKKVILLQSNSLDNKITTSSISSENISSQIRFENDLNVLDDSASISNSICRESPRKPEISITSREVSKIESSLNSSVVCSESEKDTSSCLDSINIAKPLKSKKRGRPRNLTLNSSVSNSSPLPINQSDMGADEILTPQFTSTPPPSRTSARIRSRKSSMQIPDKSKNSCLSVQHNVFDNKKGSALKNLESTLSNTSYTLEISNNKIDLTGRKESNLPPNVKRGRGRPRKFPSNVNSSQDSLSTDNGTQIQNDDEQTRNFQTIDSDANDLFQNVLQESNLKEDEKNSFSCKKMNEEESKIEKSSENANNSCECVDLNKTVANQILKSSGKDVEIVDSSVRKKAESSMENFKIQRRRGRPRKYSRIEADLKHLQRIGDFSEHENELAQKFDNKPKKRGRPSKKITVNMDLDHITNAKNSPIELASNPETLITEPGKFLDVNFRKSPRKGQPKKCARYAYINSAVENCNQIIDNDLDDEVVELSMPKKKRGAKRKHEQDDSRTSALKETEAPNISISFTSNSSEKNTLSLDGEKALDAIHSKKTKRTKKTKLAGQISLDKVVKVGADYSVDDSFCDIECVEVTSNVIKSDFTQLKKEKLFQSFSPKKCFWKALSESEQVQYYPPLIKSMPLKTKACKENVELNCFESLTLEETKNFVFFTGAPIWSSAWCPTPEDKKAIQYVAIATSGNLAEHRSYIAESESKTLIQLWNLGFLQGFNLEQPPLVQLCLTFNHGNVFDMAWCPKGCWDDPSETTLDSDLPRLGLLAIASSDSLIRIYSIPHPDFTSTEASNFPLYDSSPSVVLEPLHSANGSLTEKSACITLNWERNDDCERIAGGYGNGLICVWLLNTLSSLLLKGEEPNTLIPSLIFNAHGMPVTSLAFGWISRNKWIISTSYEKEVKFWDLTQPSMPVASVKDGLASNVDFVAQYCAAVVNNHENLSLRASHFLKELNLDASTLISIDETSSTLSKTAYSEAMNALAVVDNSGTITARFTHCLHSLGPNPETEFSKRRSAFAGKSIIPPLKPVENAESNPLSIQEGSTENTISWNPNRSSRFWLIAGGISGLARLCCFNDLKI